MRMIAQMSTLRLVTRWWHPRPARRAVSLQRSLRFDDFVLWYEEKHMTIADDGEQCEPEDSPNTGRGASKLDRRWQAVQKAGVTGGADVAPSGPRSCRWQQVLMPRKAYRPNQRIQTTRDGDPRNSRWMPTTSRHRTS